MITWAWQQFDLKTDWKATKLFMMIFSYFFTYFYFILNFKFSIYVAENFLWLFKLFLGNLSKTLWTDSDNSDF